ncbi:MAG TPA: hypothetical protein VF457_13065 [Burkholderiaceae bacterium]
MRLALIDDAGRVWHRLWSVRLSVLAAVLGAADAALPFVAPAHASPAFSALVAAVSLAAAGARLVAQPALKGGADG